MEGFFSLGAFHTLSAEGATDKMVARSPFLITLSLRVVNVKSARTSIVKSMLCIESGKDLFQLAAEPLVLPHPHSIERDTVFHRSGGGVERTAIKDIPIWIYPCH